jgi:hypothetical protein
VVESNDAFSPSPIITVRSTIERDAEEQTVHRERQHVGALRVADQDSVGLVPSRGVIRSTRSRSAASLSDVRAVQK